MPRRSRHLALFLTHKLSAVPYLSLDLTPGAGNLLGISEWELTSPWRGASSTLNTGPAPRSAEDVYTLSQILQDRVPRRYYLSKTACLGVLRRSEERGKPLPPMLEKALRIQAGLEPIENLTLPDSIAAGFSAGAGSSAGSIGYSSMKHRHSPRRMTWKKTSRPPMGRT